MRKYTRYGQSGAKEQFAYILDEAILVLPVRDGTINNYPYEKYLNVRKENGKLTITYKGKNYYPRGTIHTHPQSYMASGEDMLMQTWSRVPMFAMGKTYIWGVYGGYQMQLPFTASQLINNPQLSMQIYIPEFINVMK